MEFSGLIDECGTDLGFSLSIQTSDQGLNQFKPGLRTQPPLELIAVETAPGLVLIRQYPALVFGLDVVSGFGKV